MPDLDSQFHRAMLSIYERAAKLGYRASYFRRMVQEHGGVEAARRLLAEGPPSEGFTQLLMLNRLDLTVEALAVSERFRSLFTPDQLQRATDRLKECNYQPPPPE